MNEEQPILKERANMIGTQLISFLVTNYINAGFIFVY